MILKENKFFIFDRPKKINTKYVIKWLIHKIQRLYYSIFYLLIHPKYKTDTKYNVSVCAIFRDEADYLKEWIEYHRIVGVQHFYLYNNFSVDDYESVLSPYIEQGIVTLKEWPIKQGQYAAYEDFFNKHSSETKWVCLIDIDEFIVPNTLNNIYDILKKFENKACVIAYWKVFGSSGMIKRKKNSLVTEDFTLGYRKYIDIGKVFFNTKFEYDLSCEKGNDMHSMWAKYKGVKVPPVNIFNKICTHGFNPVNFSIMPIHINHYIIKSYSEYLEKKAKRGGGVHDISMHNMDYYFRNEMNSQTADYSAYKYLVKLKTVMGENSSYE